MRWSMQAKNVVVEASISYFVEHRHEVVVRRTQFDLDESGKKAHILTGLLIALDHLMK
jgi:DNA gyrase subunit A